MSRDDLLASRRLEFGLMLRARGDRDGAISLFQQALELADRPETHFALAEALHEDGRREAAVEHYRQALRGDPSDRMGAIVRLALLGVAVPPDQLPAAYVRTLFDQYAGRFEAALVGRLGYLGPGQLRRAVDRVSPPGEAPRRVLDLGCGTGLVGEAFRHRASWLAGVDLSPGMLAEAARKRIYDQLEAGDCVEALARAEAGFELIVAGDVLTYLGDLSALFAGLGRALVPGGLFAATLQKSECDGFRLGSDHRYAHGVDYLRGLAGRGGLEVASIEDAACRTEGGRPIPFLIVLLRRPARAAPPVPLALDRPEVASPLH